MTNYEKEMNLYGFDRTEKFVPIMPDIIEKIGGIGEVKNNNEFTVSPFDPTGRLNNNNLVVPDFVGVSPNSASEGN